MAWATYLLVEPTLLEGTRPLAAALASLGELWFAALTTVVAAAVVYPFARGRALGWSGLRYPLRYPPLWVACLLGLSGVIGWDVLRHRGPFDPSWTLMPFWGRLALSCGPILAGSFVGVTVAGLEGLLRSTTRTARPTSVEERPAGGVAPPKEQLGDTGDSKDIQLPRDAAELLRWIGDDAPIETAERAYFGHARQAERLVEKLGLCGAQGGSQGPCSEQPVILLGPKGSGKTTMGKLVREILVSRSKGRPASEVAVVQISAWPYETPQALVRGILDEIVAELGKRVNVLAFRGIPLGYLRAAESVGGLSWLSSLAAAATPRPDDQLRRLEPVLGAIRLRILVWLDDLERFAERVSGDREAALALQAPVFALLSSFQKVRGLSFVLACDALPWALDLNKLGLYVERIPTLRPEEVIGCLRLFRETLLAEKDYTNPADPGALRDLGFTDMRADMVQPVGPSNDLERSAHWERPVSDPRRLLSYLLRTPRRLKHTVRRVRLAWRTLRGEIDFDDLLAMTAIRETAPAVFGFADRHIHVLRGDTLPETQQEELQHVLQATDEEDQAAVRELLWSVFPAGGHSGRQFKPEDRPQRLREGGVTDYWLRFVNERVPDTEIRDQQIIAAIDQWVGGRGAGAFPRDLVLGKLPEGKVLALARRIPRDKLLKLLDDVSDVVLRLRGDPSGNVALVMSPGEPPNGIHLCAELWRRWGTGPADLRQTLTRLLETTVERDLALSVVLLTYVGAHDLLGEDGRAAIRQRFGELIRSKFGPGQGEALSRALSGDHAYVLCHVLKEAMSVDGLEYAPRAGGDWKGFGTAVLEAGRLSPENVLAQIAMVVVQSTSTSQVVNGPEGPWAASAYTFSGEVAAVFFDLRQLATVLATLNPEWRLAQQVRDACAEVKRWAETTLAQSPPSSPSPRGTQP